MTEQDKIRWKQRVNLYQLIQQRCDRPAYFWHNYRCKPNIHPLSGNPEYSIEEYIAWGEAFSLECALTIGYIKPQEWCDNN